MTPLPDKLRYLHDTVNTTDTRCTNPKCTNERCVGCLAFAPKDTPDTEWSSVDRYSVETGLLKRFFKLYEEGRKTGDPQNFIDYFKAEHYLLTEVGKAITSRDTYWKERVRKAVEAERVRIIELLGIECDEKVAFTSGLLTPQGTPTRIFNEPTKFAEMWNYVRKMMIKKITNEDNLK